MSLREFRLEANETRLEMPGLSAASELTGAGRSGEDRAEGPESGARERGDLIQRASAAASQELARTKYLLHRIFVLQQRLQRRDLQIDSLRNTVRKLHTSTRVSRSKKAAAQAGAKTKAQVVSLETFKKSRD